MGERWIVPSDALNKQSVMETRAAELRCEAGMVWLALSCMAPLARGQCKAVLDAAEACQCGRSDAAILAEQHGVMRLLLFHPNKSLLGRTWHANLTIK